MAISLRALAGILAMTLSITLLPLPTDSSADEPPPLPDLHLSPDDIEVMTFWDGGGSEYIYPGLVRIYVVVHNRGPGEARSVNVSICFDGRLLCILPLPEALTAGAPSNVSWVEYIWDASSLSFGEHALSAEASDPSGDVDPGDNSASRKIIVALPPALSIRTDASIQTANVTAGEAAIVRFTGSVSVDDDSGGPVEVSLHASTESGWDVDIVPRNMIFTDSSPQPFVATVLVPAGTPVTNASTLTVTGRAFNGYLADVASTRATVAIQPYQCFTVELDRSWASADAGGVAGFRITVTNTGNSIDSFEITMDNGHELHRRGWEFMWDSMNLTKLGPGRSSSSELYVRAPAAGGGRADIRLNISSLGAKSQHPPVFELRAITVEARAGTRWPVITTDIAATAIVLAAWAAAVYAVLLWRRRAGRPPTGGGRGGEEGRGNNI